MMRIFIFGVKGWIIQGSFAVGHLAVALIPLLLFSTHILNAWECWSISKLLTFSHQLRLLGSTGLLHPAQYGIKARGPEFEF